MMRSYLGQGAKDDDEGKTGSARGTGGVVNAVPFKSDLHISNQVANVSKGHRPIRIYTN